MTRIEEVLKRYVFWTDDLSEETRKEILRELERATKEVDADLRHEAGMYQSLYEVSQKRVEELRSQLVKTRTALSTALAYCDNASHPTEQYHDEREMLCAALSDEEGK